MKPHTEQMQLWASTFGQEYTDRNNSSPEECDRFYEATYGTTRTKMNQRFLGQLDRSIRILEVGANVGLQLALLQQMGFTCLYGIELQPYAVNLARQQLHHINLIEGSAFDIPFKDGFFDLIYTSGVLIHIHPNDLPITMAEIYRCSRTLIWGFEYFAPAATGVTYRGNDGFLWKADYVKLYQEQFPDLELVRREHYHYINDECNEDMMFLLQKGAGA